MRASISQLALRPSTQSQKTVTVDKSLKQARDAAKRRALRIVTSQIDSDDSEDAENGTFKASQRESLALNIPNKNTATATNLAAQSKTGQAEIGTTPVFNENSLKLIQSARSVDQLSQKSGFSTTVSTVQKNSI